MMTKTITVTCPKAAWEGAELLAEALGKFNEADSSYAIQADECAFGETYKALKATLAQILATEDGLGYEHASRVYNRALENGESLIEALRSLGWKLTLT